MWPSTYPQHGTATAILHCRDGISQVMKGAWFGIWAKEFDLCVTRPENFLYHDLRVFQIAFTKLQV